MSRTPGPDPCWSLRWKTYPASRSLKNFVRVLQRCKVVTRGFATFFFPQDIHPGASLPLAQSPCHICHGSSFSIPDTSPRVNADGPSHRWDIAKTLTIAPTAGGRGAALAQGDTACKAGFAVTFVFTDNRGTAVNF